MNPFQIILTNSDLKKKLVDGFKSIYKSLYQDIPNRWITKQMNWNGRSFEIWGPGDLNENTNTHEWSKLNLVNTNYSALEKLRNFLYYDGVIIDFKSNPLLNITETSSLIDMFINELDKRKCEYFLDGIIKDDIVSIINGTWGRGSTLSNILKDNYKTYFPTAINIDDKGDVTGDIEDMLLGIDNTIFFENEITKTTQNKGCRKVVYIDNEYHVYCPIDYSKYNDEIVNYFVFFPTEEPNNVYVFENNRRNVRNEIIDYRPVFIINESMLHYGGIK